jgi:RNA polymerase sigma factor (sigma-70 family)
MSTQNVPIETTSSLTDYSKVTITYEPVDIQDTPEDLAVKKDILQKIVDIVYEIDQDAPDKNYLRLYNLRYADGLTQKEIAQELNLSQSEVSKRLFKLMDKVKQAFNG